MAAPSVTDRIDPRRSPSSVDSPSSHEAASPVITAVISVPTPASISPGRSTGRISRKPAFSPPSKRIAARAMMPTRRASS